MLRRRCESCRDCSNVGPELFHGGGVSLASRTDGDVGRHTGRARRSKRGQQREARPFAQAALEPIPIDRAVLVSRDHDANARNAERGSEDSNVEMFGPNSLPLSNDGLNIRTPREPVLTRKVEAVVMRLRTCLAV